MPEQKKTYVIGDVHGNHVGLWRACREIGIIDRYGEVNEYWEHKLIFLGDLIDRGPDPREVLDLVKNLKNILGDKVILILGNHEWLMFRALREKNLEYFKQWVLGQDGLTTVMDYIWTPNPEEKVFDPEFRRAFIKEAADDLDWISGNFKNMHLETINGIVYGFVHAGLHPKGSMKTGGNDPEDPNDLSFMWIRHECFNHEDSNFIKNNYGIDKLFVGHTPTFAHPFTFAPKMDYDLTNSPTFMLDGNLVMCDTGSGYARGSLTVIKIDEMGESSTFFQCEGIYG